MRKRNKWLKAMSIALSCAVLATTAPMNVLATEAGTENVEVESGVANDEIEVEDTEVVGSETKVAETEPVSEKTNSTDEQNISAEIYVEYDEEVEIRYLADEDKARIIELLGLSEYDGKVICIDSARERDSYKYINPYGSGNEYGYDYDILRTDNGELTLGYNRIKDNSWYLAFSGIYSYTGYEDVKLTISYDGNIVWLLCCGDADSSGLRFTDTVEKTKVVEPFAKKGSGGNISKRFEREFEAVLAGKLNEQDIETVMNDYFGFSYTSGEFAIIPTEGSEYKIDFDKSSYEKDELYQVDIIYYALSRNEDGNMDIKRLNFEAYSFVNGKRDYSAYYDDTVDYDEEGKFLTKGEFGTDIEDCEFYIPAMDQNSDEVILTKVTLYTLDGRNQSNLMVYNDEKTLEVCNFAEVREVEDEEENTTPNDSYEVTLPADKTTISASDFAAVLEENKTKDVVIKSNNNITFTFAKGTMASVDGMESYDFGTTVVSDFANAGNMGSSVTKDNFVTRINYNYSGKLPAKADIKIYVGTDWVGKTLHYSYIMENGLKHLQSVMVDAEGYITVTQDHCSDYVVTTNKLSTNEPEDTTTPDNDKADETPSAPKTGDNSNIFTYVTMLVCGLGAVFMAMQKKLSR